MRKIPLTALEQVRLYKPNGYVEDVISRGKVEEGLLLLEDEVYIQLQEKYKNATQTKARPVTKEERRNWPLFLRPMKLLAKPYDKGLGDIVERTIGPVGGDAYKIWYKSVFGKPCGCTKRKDNLNIRYPL